MSDCSRSSRPPWLAIVTDMLKTSMKLVGASTYEIWRLPVPYTLLLHPLRVSKPVSSTLRDTFHESCLGHFQWWYHHNVQFRGLCGWMLWLTMEVSQYGNAEIDYVPFFVQHLYIILLPDSCLLWCEWTHIQFCDTSYSSYFCFCRPYLNIYPGWNFRWLHWQCLSGPSCGWILIDHQGVVYSMKHPLLCSILIPSHHVEVFVEVSFAGVEIKSKMIMKRSGKLWGKWLRNEVGSCKVYIISTMIHWNDYNQTCMF